MNLDRLKSEAVDLLQELIRIESFSEQEDETAELLSNYLKVHDITTSRSRNNVWAFHQDYGEKRPTVLLNSHHDTVRPNEGWTRDPFTPEINENKLYGLGSNDAGGAVVSLIAAFLYFSNRTLPFNLGIALTAEEEISGRNGITSILPEVGSPDLVIVGEPSSLEMAIAERAAMVLEFIARGTSGHAARNVGSNAIMKAMDDIEWFRTFHFPKTSELLGDVKMTVTMIEAGIQHNVIPDTCKFTVDVRVTDAYSNEEILTMIRENVQSELVPVSTRMQASRLPDNHPILRTAEELGIPLITSPTSSDQGLIPAPSVKIGPGDSRRSHTADEYITIPEIEAGIDKYIAILENLQFRK